MYSIYGLSNSDYPELIRYIGYTKRSLKERLYEHVKWNYRKKDYRTNWILKNKRENREILITLLDTADTFEEIERKEIHYIKLYKSFGARLVNSTVGGGGCKGYKQLESQKQLNAERKSKKIYCFRYDTRELVGEFLSLLKMQEELGLMSSGIRYTIYKKYRHHKGYVFSYTNNYPEVKIGRDKPRKTEKSQNSYGLHRRSILLKSSSEDNYFISVKEASEFLKTSSSNVHNHYRLGKEIRGYQVIKLNKNGSYT